MENEPSIPPVLVFLLLISLVGTTYVQIFTPPHQPYLCHTKRDSDSTLAAHHGSLQRAGAPAGFSESWRGYLVSGGKITRSTSRTTAGADQTKHQDDDL